MVEIKQPGCLIKKNYKHPTREIFYQIFYGILLMDLITAKFEGELE